jgi:Trehalose utilisation
MRAVEIASSNRILFAATLFIAVAAAQPVHIVHDDAAPMQTLAAGLKRHGMDVRLMEQAAFREGPDAPRAAAIFMYVHGALDPAVEERLIRYAQNGGRLIVLHHGAASGKVAAPRWLPFLGMKILPRDAADYPWKVLRGNYQLVNLNSEHYVTNYGVGYDHVFTYTPSDSPAVAEKLPGIELADTELFHNQLFTDARNKTVLLGMKGEIDGKVYMQDRGGWMMPAGKGHVFYFQPGHNARDFEHPAYARILRNAAAWRPGMTPHRPVVAVDGFHNNEKQPHYRWNGTYQGGFSQLGALLNGMGAETRTIQERLTAQSLAGVDCLIIVDPDTPAETESPQYISTQEAVAVVAWVRSGGKLLLLGNDAGNAEFEHFNGLARRFGFEFVESVIRTSTGNGKLTLDVEPAPGVFPRRAKFYAVDVAPLKLTMDARPLLKMGETPVMGIANVGRGAVFALGDPWIYNEYIGSAENRALAADLFRSLLFGP